LKIKRCHYGQKLTALETLKVVPDVVVGLWSLATLPPKIALLSVSKEGRKQLKENISTLPKEIQRSLEAEGKTAKLNPSQTAGRLVGLVGTTALLTKGLSKVGKLSGSLRARVSPKFVGTAKKGGILKLNLGGKKVNIKIAGKLGGKYLPKETLAAQIKLAGKKIPAVVSAQADKLVNIIKRQRIIRKPFPNEAKFSKETKRLLKKFDLKKISSNQILRLDNLIKRQGGKGILERSFFADPRGRLRPSRIGHEKEASLLDYFSGEVRYKTQKPQVLLFGDVKVQKLPNYLKEIGKKLKSNKVLTNLEANKLLKFQLKKSGKFKPIGFLSGEPEITLAPGEIIKRIKKVGVTIINKKRVPIIQTKVVKASDKLKSLLKKSNLGKLSVKELNTLKKMLKKETGFSSKLSDSAKKLKKYFPLKRKIAGIGISLIPPSKLPPSKLPPYIPPISKKPQPAEKLPSKKKSGAVSRKVSPAKTISPIKVISPVKVVPSKKVPVKVVPSKKVPSKSCYHPKKFL